MSALLSLLDARLVPVMKYLIGCVGERYLACCNLPINLSARARIDRPGAIQKIGVVGSLVFELGNAAFDPVLRPAFHNEVSLRKILQTFSK